MERREVDGTIERYDADTIDGQALEKSEGMTKTRDSIYTKTFVVWFGALICCALWGSAFPCIKIGYNWFEIAADDTMTQMLFAGLRFTLAGIIAIAIGSIIRRKFLFPKKRTWLRVAKLSSLQTIAQYVFFYIGLAHTTGVKASIVEGVNVFVAILVASLIFHQEKLTAKKIIGSIIGFAGVVLINLVGSDTNLKFNLLGDGFVFLSTVAYAFSSVLLKRYSKEDDPVVLSGYQFVFGGIVMAAVGFIFGGRLTIVSTKGILMLVYLAFVSAVAYSLWGILLKYNPISKVAVFGFMNPVFGVVLSAVLLPEASALGVMSLVSLALICVGIFIVNYEKEKTK